MPNLFELLYNAGKGRVSHEFGVVRPYRTCLNYCTMLPKEYAGEFHMISGWFDHAEPVPTKVQHRVEPP